MTMELDQPLESYQHSNTDRRFLLITTPNPNASIDYVIAIKAIPHDEQIRVRIRYIPDKLILQPDAFEQYLLGMDNLQDMPLEAQAMAILEDINNELVPRWVEIHICSERTKHHVLIEDRQPLWDNPGLLRRLEPSC